MKKTFATLTTLGAFLTLAQNTFALSICGNGSTSALCNNADSNRAESIIGTAINFFFVIATIVALFYLVWGGFKWITSQGEKAGVEGARSQIINALIGLVIVFLSYVILNVVLGFFGLSINNITFPHI